MSKKDMLGHIVRALVSIPKGRLGVVLDIANKLGGADGELWKDRLVAVLREGVKSKASIVKTIRESIESSLYLQRLFKNETIIIGPTDGMRTIAQAKDVFTGGIDPDFVNLGLDNPGKATEQTEVIVPEMINNGIYSDIFESLHSPFERLCFMQDQIIDFVIRHKDKLGRDVCGTFFLLKKDPKLPATPDNLFVTRVHVRSDGPRARVYRFSYGSVWYASSRHRFAFPQPAL